MYGTAKTSFQQCTPWISHTQDKCTALYIVGYILTTARPQLKPNSGVAREVREVWCVVRLRLGLVAKHTYFAAVNLANNLLRWVRV